MAVGFYLTSTAQQDLMAICHYCKQAQGQNQTRNYLRGMLETIELLAQFPEQGIAEHEIEEGVFSYPYGNHVLYCRMEQRKLVIFAVLHRQMVPVRSLRSR